MCIRDRVTFQWNPAARAIKYQFQLALNSGFAGGDIMVDTEVPYPYIGSTISGLPDNGWDFSWRVRANNSIGWSSWSQTRPFINGPSAGPALPTLSRSRTGAAAAGTHGSLSLLFPSYACRQRPWLIPRGTRRR